MNILTSQKCDLLNNFQRKMIENALNSKRDFMLIIPNHDCVLKIHNFYNINDLYDFLTVNYQLVNYKGLLLFNDDYTIDIVNILLDLIKKENELVKKYRQVLINVNIMLKQYDDYVLQFTYENYLINKYEYHSTRSLIEFIEEIKKHKQYIYCVNKLIYDACIYVIRNDIDLREWGIECE